MESIKHHSQKYDWATKQGDEIPGEHTCEKQSYSQRAPQLELNLCTTTESVSSWWVHVPMPQLKECNAQGKVGWKNTIIWPAAFTVCCCESAANKSWKEVVDRAFQWPSEQSMAWQHLDSVLLLLKWQNLVLFWHYSESGLRPVLLQENRKTIWNNLPSPRPFCCGYP